MQHPMSRSAQVTAYPGAYLSWDGVLQVSGYVLIDRDLMLYKAAQMLITFTGTFEYGVPCLLANVNMD